MEYFIFKRIIFHAKLLKSIRIENYKNSFIPLFDIGPNQDRNFKELSNVMIEMIMLFLR